MIAYDKLFDCVFKKVTVWADDPAELFFYQWAWEKIAPVLKTDDLTLARIEALALAYVYAELCHCVCGENFYEDLWDRLAEFVDGDMDLSLGFMCGELGDGDCPEDEEDAMRILVRANHERVVTALKSIDTMEFLTAFHASYSMPQHLVTDEDGDEMEDDMITSYDDFVRYVDDGDFRDEDIGGMSVSDYEAAYDWWECGAEMLDARTASDEG